MNPRGVWRGGESCWPTSAASVTLTSAGSEFRRSDFHINASDVTGKPELPQIIFPFYSLLKDTEWSPYGSPTVRRNWCTQDLIRADLKPVNPIGGDPHLKSFPMSSMRTSRWSKSSKCTFKRPLHKHSSSIEVFLSLAVMTTLQDVRYRVICVVCSCA